MKILMMISGGIQREHIGTTPIPKIPRTTILGTPKILQYPARYIIFM
jgi:hypothetical protein